MVAQTLLTAINSLTNSDLQKQRMSPNSSANLSVVGTNSSKKAMKIYFILFTLALGVIIANCKAKSVKGDAVQKSPASKLTKDEEKQKVDSETKEQLEESENDDEALEQQEKEAKQKDESDENATEDPAQESDEGSSEEATVENADETEKKDDESNDDESTAKRGEELDKDEGRTEGKRVMAYPILYPGDYLGHHQGLSGLGGIGGLGGIARLGGPSGFHPGSVWEYPFPYVHPMYPSPFFPCVCNCKNDKEKNKDKKEKSKKTRRKQLIPSHYYGPPSAGWGGFQPGHCGCGWGTPAWYKSYIPLKMPVKEAPKSESGESRHTIHEGLDFGIAHNTRDSSHNNYEAFSGLSLADDFGAGWHDGYTEHPVYGTYGGGAGRSAFVDPMYGDLENSALSGWGHGVGQPYLPYNGYGHTGVAHGHLGQQHGIGHPYIPTNAGLNAHAVQNGDTFYGPHTAMLPTAQGHIQVASSGHSVGMGGHNLGGFADRLHSEQGHLDDFVGGIHADLSSHHISGHHHDHAAAGHMYAPLLHTDGLDGDIGDHFGALSVPRVGHYDLGMADHFGPILEHNGHGYGAAHHGIAHGFHGHGGHGLNHRLYHNFGGVHAAHGGILGGPIGDSLSAGHLFGGVHKSGVPLKQKHTKKTRGKVHKKKQ